MPRWPLWFTTTKPSLLPTSTPSHVEEVRPLADLSAEQALAWAGALEQMSEHPIARAFLASGKPVAAASGVEVHAGRGLAGRVDGRQLRIGTRAFAAELLAGQAGGPAPASVPGGDATEESWVYLGGEQGLLAAFRLTDPLRPEARDCVAGLAALGLHSEIASGDEAATVARVAARCGIDTHAARLAPADQLAVPSCPLKTVGSLNSS